MSSRRQYVVCKKIQAISKDFYMLINSSECEDKLCMGYRLYFQTGLSDPSLINSYVHKKCYVKVTRKLPSIKSRKRQI